MGTHAVSTRCKHYIKLGGIVKGRGPPGGKPGTYYLFTLHSYLLAAGRLYVPIFFLSRQKENRRAR